MRFQQLRNAPPKPGIRAGLRRRGGDVFRAAMAGAGFWGRGKFPPLVNMLRFVCMENFDFASNVSAPLKAGMQSMGAAALKSEGLRRSRSAPSRILAPVGKEIPCGIGSARRAGAAMERRILAESGVSAPMLGKPAGFLPQNARSERAKRGGERILPAICAFPTPCRFFATWRPAA